MIIIILIPLDIVISMIITMIPCCYYCYYLYDYYYHAWSRGASPTSMKVSSAVGGSCASLGMYHDTNQQYS